MVASYDKGAQALPSPTRNTILACTPTFYFSGPCPSSLSVTTSPNAKVRIYTVTIPYCSIGNGFDKDDMF